MRQQPSLPLLKEFGQRILEQRQSARLIIYLADHFCDQSRLEGHTRAFSGSGDGAFQLFSGQG